MLLLSDLPKFPETLQRQNLTLKSVARKDKSSLGCWPAVQDLYQLSRARKHLALRNIYPKTCLNLRSVLNYWPKHSTIISA